MKKIAFVLLLAALGGCAIVPLAPPPLYIGVHGGGYWDGGHRGGWRY